MDFDDLKDGFMLEAIELLDEAEEALLGMDSGGSFQDCYNMLFRSFHSLKGASGMFGLEALQEHMHKLESLLDGAKVSLSKSNVDYFLDGVDAARSYFKTDTINFQYITSLSEEPKHVIDTSRKEEIKTHIKEKKSSEKGVIFVVDDKELILDLICDILEEAGYKVHTFSSGDELLESIVLQTPELIVSDINMPGIDGLAMSTKIREMGYDMPVIFVSAYVTKEAILTGLKNGANYYIEKPFDEKTLLTVVASTLAAGRAKKALSSSIDYILYQFSNHEESLRQLGKEKEIKLMKDEIHKLIQLKNDL